MIDGFSRLPRRPNDLHPRVRDITDNIVVGGSQQDSFKPPQEVAAAEEQQPQTKTDGSNPPADKITPPGKRSFVDWLKSLSGRQKTLLIVGLVLILAGAGFGAYLLFFKPQPAPVVTSQGPSPKAKPPAPTTVASNLTGLQVDPSINERPVTAIMIENSTSARPQAGIDQAGVVFEAIAEGGITRFVTLFQDTEPDYVGPVRSVRPYYLTWLLGFDAAVAHAGGSAEALNYISQWHVKDLNHNSNFFWRVNSREAPHNLFTSIAKLREYEASKGFGKANYSPLPRKEKEEPIAVPTARIIDLNISSANFNVHYEYDKATNSYKRSEGGAPHVVDKTGAQISPKVVVVLVIPQGKNDIYTTYQTIGSGQVLIFQDGGVATGTWKKDSNNANFTFADANGSPLKLNPGQTWFTALGTASQATYAP